MLLLIIALAAWPAMVQCVYEYGGVIAGSTDGGDSSIAKYAMLQNPSHIAFDATGLLYFTDKTNHRVCKITSTGKLVVIAGTHSLTHLLTHLFPLTHSLTYSLTHSLTSSLLLTHSSPTYSPIHSPPPSYSLTCRDWN